MEVDCEGCAGCCIDWRPLAEGDIGRSHIASLSPSTRYTPLDDIGNFVALARDEIRSLIDAGLSDGLIPRLWTVKDGGVSIGSYRLAAIDSHPVFFIGLRKTPKPIAPFGTSKPQWLDACVFLDPSTLQCRIHGTELYPSECDAYPSYNVLLGAETECERVERHTGSRRLLDTDVEDVDAPLLGPQAIGQKLFVHPWPEELEESLDAVAAGDLSEDDRAEFIGIAAASSPGTTSVSIGHYERAKADVAGKGSWISKAIEERADRRATIGSTTEDTDAGLEERHGAPRTPGWGGDHTD